MVTHIKNARVSFDGLELGEVVDVEVPLAGPDTCDFSSREKSPMILTGAQRWSGKFTLDIESAKNVRALMMLPYQQAAIERISKLAGRAAKFEFCPPVFYHGDMMARTDDRRFMVTKPSAERMTEGRVWNMLLAGDATFGKFARPANVGKTESFGVWGKRLLERMEQANEAGEMIARMAQAMIADPEEVRVTDARRGTHVWHRTGPHHPMPSFESIRSSILRAKVRDICANWGKHGR